MTLPSQESAPPRQLHLDRLLGRRVLARNNQSVGRLEEFRAERHGTGLVVMEYVIGAAGMLERLGVGFNLVFGRKSGGYVARWDQIDISDPDHPRLLCGASDLRKV